MEKYTEFNIDSRKAAGGVLQRSIEQIYNLQNGHSDVKRPL
jgi:hypothetical protein